MLVRDSALHDGEGVHAIRSIFRNFRGTDHVLVAQGFLAVSTFENPSAASEFLAQLF